MPFDSSRVIQGYDGQLLNAPLGTLIPPTLTDPIDTALWRNVGWCVEDGHSLNPNMQSEDPIKAWPRGEIIKRPAPTLEPELTFQLLQHADALDYLVNPSVQGSWILEYRDSVTAATHRLIIPRAMPTEMSEITFNASDVIGHEITVGAIRDDLATVGALGSEVVGFTFAFVIPGPTPGVDVIKAY